MIKKVVALFSGVLSLKISTKKTELIIFSKIKYPGTNPNSKFSILLDDNEIDKKARNKLLGGNSRSVYNLPGMCQFVISGSLALFWD